MEKIDYFKEKSKTYSKDSKRVRNVHNIADGILKRIKYSKDMHLMDFGSGTGLLTIQIAPYVKKITGVDMSPSMNETLLANKDQVSCELEVLEIDLSSEEIKQKFDGIISSMTLHHIEDIENLFKKFYSMLKNNGTIALSDLYTEDGSFHSENTGVFHLGFDEEFIVECARNANFKNIQCQQVSVAQKPNGNYPIFLLTANK